MSSARHHGYGLGFRFRGVGLDANESEATVWGRGGRPGGSNFEWLDDVLINIPTTLSDKTDPSTLDVQSSQVEPTFHNTKQVGETFKHQATEEIAVLTSSIDDTTTTIPIDVSGLDGQVVQIGREAIRLGSDTGSAYGSSTRAYWGTSSTPHSSGDHAYDHPPYWRGRIVDLVTWHASRGEKLERIYYVTDINESPDGEVHPET